MCSSMNCCTRFCSSLTLADGSRFIKTSGFLQNGDLPGMIQIMLNDAMEQKVDGVGLAGDRVVETLGIERGNSAAQFFMRTLQVAKSDLPGGFVGIGNGGPILRGREFQRFALQTSARGIDPGCNVESE